MVSWTLARQISLSRGFPRQGYCSGLLSLPPGDLPNTGLELASPALQVNSLPTEPPGKPDLPPCGSKSRNVFPDLPLNGQFS